MRYDAVLIDADDTLFDFQQAERRALKLMLDKLGLDGAAEDAYRACNHACWRALERGEITQARLRYKRFQDFLRVLGRDDDPVETGDFYMDALSRQGMLLPGALEAVQTIAGALPIAIVTNGIAPIQHGRIDHSPIRPFIKALVISEEVGVAKPNPRMIHEALRALGGVLPSRALMVGDSLASDVLCARNAGTDVCWLNSQGAPRPKDIPIAHEIARIAQLPAVALLP